MGGPKMRGGPSVPGPMCGFSAALGFLAMVALGLNIVVGLLDALG